MLDAAVLSDDFLVISDVNLVSGGRFNNDFSLDFLINLDNGWPDRSINVDNSNLFTTLFDQCNSSSLFLFVDESNLIVDDKLSGTHFNLSDIISFEFFSDKFVSEENT